jgi:hypothetical protein
MRSVRPIFLATLLLAAAPIQSSYADAPAPKPAATSKAAAGSKASAQPSAASAAPPATAKASAAPAASAAPTASPYEIATEVDAAMSDKAQALVKEGNAYYREGKFSKAQASYKAAWALDLHSQRLVNNLGMTELQLGMFRDAAEHLTIALRLADPNDPKRPRIQTQLNEARAKVGTITLKLNTDGVEIVQIETGATYMAPLVDPIFVDPGHVSFRIRREGFLSQEKVFDIKAGETASADITLERAPGYDGKSAGTGTATTGGGTTVTPRSKVPAFVLGGVGLAGLIIGGALVGVAAGKNGENETNAPKDANGNPLCGRTASSGEDARCAGLRTNADTINSLGNTGIGLLVGGGVLVAAGAIYLLLPPSKASADKRSSKLVPVVGHEGGGLVWTGSF